MRVVTALLRRWPSALAGDVENALHSAVLFAEKLGGRIRVTRRDLDAYVFRQIQRFSFELPFSISRLVGSIVLSCPDIGIDTELTGNVRQESTLNIAGQLIPVHAYEAPILASSPYEPRCVHCKRLSFGAARESIQNQSKRFGKVRGTQQRQLPTI